MSIDEQIARAWGRLHDDAEAYHNQVGEWLYKSSDGIPSWQWLVVPDPTTDPWEWWVALARSGVQVILEWEFQTKSWMVWHDGDTHFGDTPEAALEATIRAWEASQ